MKFEKNISIIGGAGHVGFPLALSFTQKNYNVNLVDLNTDALKKIEKGELPFYEINAKNILKKALRKKNLKKI